MDKAVTRQDVIDECCALIKAADDAAADNDYMLDSDDCIKVLRGTWGGPLANDMPPAPSPGIDAAEQKPVAYLIDWPDEPDLGHYFAEEPSRTARSRALVLADAAPPAAQPSADNAQFPFYELRFIMRVLSHQGSAPKEDWQTAYGMARDIFVRWSKDRVGEPWCETMGRPKSKCGCPDCGPSLIDLGPGLRNTPGKP